MSRTPSERVSDRLKDRIKLGLRLLLFRFKQPALYGLAIALRHRLLGRRVRLDVATLCQLKCLSCATADGSNRKGTVGWGFLAARDFERFLDQNPDLGSMEIGNWGEIFLNPELPAILAAAHARGIRLSCVSGANLNRASDEALEALVRYGFEVLTVSIDGASDETYAQYRVGGSFQRVIANVRKINEYKRIHGSDRPRLIWQFIIFGHNEHELPLARSMAEELGMEFVPKLNHTPSVSPVRDEEFVRIESGLGVASREEFRSRKREEYNAPCAQLWTEPQINWDGKLLGCCVNRYGDFGNVFEEGLQPLLASERYAYARKLVLGLVPPRADQPCLQCPVYRRMHPGDGSTA